MLLRKCIRKHIRLFPLIVDVYVVYVQYYLCSPFCIKQTCVFSDTGVWGQTMGQQPSNQKVVKQTGALDSSQNSLSASSMSPYPGASPRSISPSTPNRKQDFTEVIIQDKSPRITSAVRRPDASWEASQVTLSSHKNAVSDVPFRLGELLQLTEQTRNGAYNCLVRIPNIDVSSYRYDFELERSVVRDSSNNIN